MQISTMIGRKIDQTQGFLEDGTRVPFSIISVAGNVVTQIKTADHEGYNSIQLGFGTSRRPTKPMAGHIKKAGLQEKKPRFFREIRVDESPDYNLGSAISVSGVFEPGDVVDVTGTSKGKGYAGVVKLHGFHGGPKTHGQSDRHRAPGASGSGTTPGRVYRGKKMSGRMGNEQVTIKNLEILDVKEDTILVRGLIPGTKGSIIIITKVGKNKKFMPLWGGLSSGSGEGEGARLQVERDSGGVLTSTEDGEHPSTELEAGKTEATEVQMSVVDQTQVEKSTEVESKTEESSSVVSGETIKEEENAS